MYQSSIKHTLENVLITVLKETISCKITSMNKGSYGGKRYVNPVFPTLADTGILYYMLLCIILYI